VTAKARYEFLECFDGALVSGEIGISKPGAAFFELLIETFSLVPERTLYVEDNIANLRAAADMGFVARHIVSSAALEMDLRRHCLIGAMTQ
jgi:2-haloacid dehalogenase